MNTTLEPTLPDLYAGDAAAPPPGDERVLILSFLYLQAGLAPEAAYRSALADHLCGLTV